MAMGKKKLSRNLIPCRVVTTAEVWKTEEKNKLFNLRNCTICLLWKSRQMHVTVSSPWCCERQDNTDRELLFSPSLGSLPMSFNHQHVYCCTTICLGKLLLWNSFIYCYLTPTPFLWQNQRLLAFVPSTDSLYSKQTYRQTNKQPQRDQTIFLYQNLLSEIIYYRQ